LDSTGQTCDTDCYRIRHTLLETICFFLRLQRGIKRAPILGTPVEHERTSLNGKESKTIEQQHLLSRRRDQLAATGMNRWGASSKCRNDLTVGIDPNAATTTLSNVSCLVEETSNSYSILNAWRNYVRKSNGASRIASTLVCLIILLCFCSPRVDAASTPDDSNEQATRALTSSESLLLFDSSTPPEPYPPQFLKRAASTSSSAPSVSTASSDALPRPFDAGLGNNFTTSSCPIFFKQFLSDNTFNECVPLSFLLQVSLDHSDHLHEL
jgi:hypothetical protein